MVATQTIQDELEKRGFLHIRRWSRGVDTTLFRPYSKDEIGRLAPQLADLPAPIFLYVGRGRGGKKYRRLHGRRSARHQSCRR